MSVRFSLLVLCALAGSALTHTANAQERLKGEAPGLKSIVREGEGARRKSLDASELKPFSFDALSKLSEWSSGKALTGQDLAGKIVVLCTWSDYLPASKRATLSAKRMADKFAKDGVVFIIAHDKEEWASATKPTASDNFFFAHDAKNEFRAALNTDGDPDFYIIDRAGQMRFADVGTESVDAAITLLVAETADFSKNVNQMLADERKSKDVEDRKTAAISSSLDLKSIPELEFRQPTDQEYKDAKWPPLPRDPDKPLDADATVATVKLALPTNNWFPKKPNNNGRVVLLYFWHPVIKNSYIEYIPFFDRLQRAYGRDVVIVGMVMKPDKWIPQGMRLTADDKDPVKIKERMENLGKGRNIEHYLCVDPGDMIGDVIETNQISLPFVILMSSDGTARWWNTNAATSYEAALRQMLKVDPAVLARRKVEEEWIKKTTDAAAKDATTPAADAPKDSANPAEPTPGTKKLR